MENNKSQRKPNTLLKHEREKRGWSQNKLAELIGADPTMISRWERSSRSPERLYQEKLCELFNKNTVELGFIEPSIPSNAQLNGSYHNNELEEQDMNKYRRDFIKGSFGLALMATTTDYAPWERLSSALKKPTYVDATLLFELKTITQSYWRRRANYSSHSLLRNVTDHLDSVTELLHHSYSEEIRKRLCSIAGEIAQLAGQISFDMKEHSTANAFYNASIEAAQEAMDPVLYASALGRKSFVIIHDEKPEEALKLLQKAQQLAKSGGTETTYGWLSAIEAETYANMQGSPNRIINSQRALERSESAISQASTDDDPYWTAFNHSRLAGYKGVCYNRLNQPDKAIQSLNDALSTITPSAIRSRSRILTDIAIAYALQGEVEEGCKFATRALELTRQTKSAMVLQRIYNFRAHVEQWKHTQAIQELDQELLLF